MPVFPSGFMVYLSLGNSGPTSGPGYRSRRADWRDGPESNRAFSWGYRTFTPWPRRREPSRVPVFPGCQKYCRAGRAPIPRSWMWLPATLPGRAAFRPVAIRPSSGRGKEMEGAGGSRKPSVAGGPALGDNHQAAKGADRLRQPPPIFAYSAAAFAVPGGGRRKSAAGG